MTEGASTDVQGDRRLPPEALRRAIRSERRPVRPLLPPIARGLGVLLAASGAAAFLISMAGLRPDRGMIDPWLVWLPALARLLAGGFLILLALREGVPGSGAPGRVGVGSLLAAPVLLALLAEWVAVRSGDAAITVPWAQVASTLGCYPREVLLAIPALFVFAWLLGRAYPLRPVFAATAGGAGAGLLADAAMHLVCPISAVGHTLLVHGGAVVSVAALSALSGWLAARRRFAATRA